MREPAGKVSSPRGQVYPSISGRSVSTTFSYDPNGQTSGLGRSISYTSFNKPSSITQGSGTLFFTYDADHQRTAPEGITRYFDAFGVHAELFSSAVSRWNDYLMVGSVLIGVRVLHNSDQTVSTRYFHTDNLGSIAVITDENGAVVERDSYDAWGKRRFPTGADDPSGAGCCMDRRQARLRGGGAQARGDHACDVARRQRVPLEGAKGAGQWQQDRCAKAYRGGSVTYE